MPSEKARQTVGEQQLEYHRRQMAEEQRRAAAPSGERKQQKPALFGLVGKKAA
jgi:hypothetical protein